MRKTMILVGIMSLGIAYAQQGRVGVNTETPEASFDIKERLDKAKVKPINDQIQGLSLPNFTTVQRAEFGKTQTNSMKIGTLIYNTTKKCVEMYLGYIGGQHKWTCLTIANDEGNTQSMFTAVQTRSATKSYTKNNCSSGYRGTTVDYTRSVTETATSTISQSDADSKAAQLAQQEAQRLVNNASEGQKYANDNGSCVRKSTSLPPSRPQTSWRAYADCIYVFTRDFEGIGGLVTKEGTEYVTSQESYFMGYSRPTPEQENETRSWHYEHRCMQSPLLKNGTLRFVRQTWRVSEQ